MMAGHFAFAAMVKSREKQLPLWSLMLASQWLDVIFVPLFVAGVERMSAAPGTSGYGSGVFVIPYTHSLAGALALVAAAMAGGALAGGGQGAGGAQGVGGGL